MQAFSNAERHDAPGARAVRANLGPALAAARPLFRDTTPVIKNQLRPFSVAVQPLAQMLAPAAPELQKATPQLANSIGVLNALFNTLAYQPGGASRATCSGAPG